MFGSNGNYKIFIKYKDGHIFDDLDNTQDTLMGYPIIPIMICGSLVYTNEIGICIPARIYDHILQHTVPPVITHPLPKPTPKTAEMAEMVEMKEEKRAEMVETPVLLVDKDGRFVKFYKGVGDVIKKYPEFNADSIITALNGEYNKMYGKYWCWDYMYYVRMELRHNGHVL
jgi:hypothetical protein